MTVLLLSALISGCGSGDLPKAVWVTDLEPGYCIDFTPGKLTSADQVEQVECDGPHDMEVYGFAPYANEKTAAQKKADADAAASATSVEEYPGEKQIQAVAAEKCSESFRTYLGDKRPRDGTIPQQAYELTYFYPSAEAWNAAGKKREQLGKLDRLIDRPTKPERQATCLMRRSVPADVHKDKKKWPECRPKLDGTGWRADAVPQDCLTADARA